MTCQLCGEFGVGMLYVIFQGELDPIMICYSCAMENEDLILSLVKTEQEIQDF